MNVLGTQAIPIVKYKEYFELAKGHKYESTRHVVDSLLRYERLLNYRFYVTKGNNPHYSLLLKLLDVTLSDSRFYKHLFNEGRELNPRYLYHVLYDFRRGITIKYPAKAAKPWIVKDTLQLIKVWMKALYTLHQYNDDGTMLAEKWLDSF